MKNKTSFVFVYWWMLLLFVLGISLLVFGEKEERISESESRVLSGFPDTSAESIFSGEFSAGFDSYLSDGMFGRDTLVGISEGLIRVFSGNTDADRMLLDEREMAGELQGNTDDQPADDPSLNIPENAPEATNTDEGADDIPDENSATTEISGYGFWLELTSGEYINLASATEDNVRKVADNLNQYRACLPEGGNVFYTNVARTKQAQMLLDTDKYKGWFENYDTAIAPYLNDGVHYINSIELLESDIIAGEHMYFESDHHWTPRSASKIVDECMRLQGTPIIGFDEYAYKHNTFKNREKGTADDLELLYPLQNVTGYEMVNGKRDEPCSLIYHHLTTYYAYLYGDTRGWVQYDTGFTRGRNALVIGDSFSNPFLCYLMPYYDEVNKVDIRHYKPGKYGISVSDIIREHEVDDVFIIVTHLNGISGKNSTTRLERILNEKN